MNESNPYSPPPVASGAAATSGRPPVFCLAMFGFSLLLCCLRLPLLALDLSADSMGYDPAFEPTIIPGIVTSAGIVFFGIIGNALLLRRMYWGIPIGVCLILSVAASIGVDIWMHLISRSLPGYRGTILSESISFCVELFRLMLLILYAAALAGFRGWYVRSKATLNGREFVG